MKNKIIEALEIILKDHGDEIEISTLIDALELILDNEILNTDTSSIYQLITDAKNESES